MRVTADLFSGRPNPWWTLRPDEANALLSRLHALPPAPGAAPADGDEDGDEEDGGLGYRGLRVSPERHALAGWDELRVGGGRVRAVSPGRRDLFTDAGGALEAWLVETGRGRVAPEIHQVLRREAGAPPPGP